MIRIVLGIVAGLIAWLVVFVGSEMVLSVISPAWYGAHQIAFTAAIKNGGQFTADTTVLLMQFGFASVGSVLSGFLAALIARENRQAPLVVGILLFALALLKAIMSWPHVPIWYHVIFTAVPLPMAIMGGKLKNATPK